MTIEQPRSRRLSGSAALRTGAVAFFVVAALLTPHIGSSNTPAGRLRSAVVQDRDGVPCFGIEDSRRTRRQTPSIDAVSVSQPGSAHLPLWVLSFAKQGKASLPMSPGDCLLYGAGGTSPAPRLQPRQHYLVSLQGFDPTAKRGLGVHSYSGHFCLVPQGEALQVKQIHIENGAPRWQDCEP